MEKAKQFIPASVFTSVLAIPTVTLAHGNGTLVSEPVRAERVQLTRATYHDRMSASTHYSMNFHAAVARVEAQARAFESHGGVRSSSAAHTTTRAASDTPIHVHSCSVTGAIAVC